MLDLKRLGRDCQRFRKRQGITQWRMGIEIGYSEKSISAFECGRNNNAALLCEYVKRGFDLKGWLYGTPKD